MIKLLVLIIMAVVIIIGCMYAYLQLRFRRYGSAVNVLMITGYVLIIIGLITSIIEKLI